MKKGEIVFYFDYDEKTNSLSIIEDTYQGYDNKLYILSNTIIPKQMIYRSKKYIEWNKKIIEKLFNFKNKKHKKTDPYFFYTPFSTGLYKTIFGFLKFSIKQTLLKLLKIYIWGLIKLPFIPFIRYFENIKKNYDNNLKLEFLNKSKGIYSDLLENNFPQNEKEILQYLSGKSIEEIKKQKSDKLAEIDSNIKKLNQDKQKIIEDDTNLANMTLSLIIATISLVIALFSLKISTSENKKEENTNINSQVTEITRMETSIDNTEITSPKENTAFYQSLEIDEFIPSPETIENASILENSEATSSKENESKTYSEKNTKNDIDDEHSKVINAKDIIPSIIVQTYTPPIENQSPTFSVAK